MMKRVFLVCLTIFFVVFLVDAQDDRFIKSYELSFNVGFQIIDSDSFPDAEHLDFNDYLERSPWGTFPEPDISFYGSVTLSDRLKVESNLLLGFGHDFDLTATYWVLNNLGLKAGIYTHVNYISYYDSYFVRRYLDFSDINLNDRQRKIKDRGFVFGPQFNFRTDRFRTELAMNFRFGVNKPFVDNFYLREIGGNQKNLIQYKVYRQWHTVFFPAWKISYDILRGDRVTCGVDASVRYYFSKQRINYVQTFGEWTDENLVVTTPKLPAHKLTRLYPEIGLFWRW